MQSAIHQGSIAENRIHSGELRTEGVNETAIEPLGGQRHRFRVELSGAILKATLQDWATKGAAALDTARSKVRDLFQKHATWATGRKMPLLKCKAALDLSLLYSNLYQQRMDPWHLLLSTCNVVPNQV